MHSKFKTIASSELSLATNAQVKKNRNGVLKVMTSVREVSDLQKLKGELRHPPVLSLLAGLPL
jgi:hypothetical protein